MIAWQVSRHRVSLAGSVCASGTLRPIAGATVRIIAMPATFHKKLNLIRLQFGNAWDGMAMRADKTRTREDGLFYFCDLPEGEYTLEASVTPLSRRYAVATAKAVVIKEDGGVIPLKTVDILLNSTIVTGKVAMAGGKTPIVLAAVRVRGSGESTYTDESGNYVLRAIEPGHRVIEVSAQGYKPALLKVNVKLEGKSPPMNYNLDRGS